VHRARRPDNLGLAHENRDLLYRRRQHLGADRPNSSWFEVVLGLLPDHAVAYPDDPVARGRHVWLVGHKDECPALALVELAQERQDLLGSAPRRG